jgi:CHAT domain-containing protein/tetratricopeptide (TPR) repeat protein
LQGVAAPPAPAEAEAIWQRATTHRLDDPATFLELATALLAASDPSFDPSSTGDPSAAPAPHPNVTVEIAATRGMAWCCYAEALNASGQVAAAITAYERAMEEAERAERPDVLGQVLVGRVHVLSLAGRAREAAELFERAEEILRRHQDDLRLGKLYTNRGNALYQEDRYREAFACYQQADRLLAEAAPEDTTRAVLLLNQAVVASKLEDVSAASELYGRAESLGREFGLGRLTAFALHNRALLEQTRGDYRTALRLLDEAGDMFRAQETRDMIGAVQLARAEIHLELGMPSEAIAGAREAVEHFASAGMDLDAVLARITEGRSLAQTGERAPAAELMQEALGYFRGQGNRMREAVVRLYLAEAAAECGEPAESIEHAEAALALFASLGAARWEARARTVAARALLALERLSAAEAMLEPFIRRAASLPLTERQAFWAAAGRVSLRRDRRTIARRRLQRSASLLEAARRLIPGTELRARRFAEQVGVYHDLIELELHRPSVARLLAFSERARARGFRDLVASAPRGVGAGMEEQRARLGALTRRLEEAELELGGDTSEADLDAIKRPLMQLEREMVAAWQRTGEREETAPEELVALDVDRLAGTLGDDEALVCYFVSGERLLAMVISHSRRGHVVLSATTADLELSLGRMAFQIESALLAAASGQGNLVYLRRSADAVLTTLYDMLIAPIEDLLPERGRLTIVPHGLLHGVPFECLRDGSDYVDRRWVVARRALCDAGARAGEGGAARGPVLVSGTVQGGPAAVQDELRVVAEAAPDDDVVVIEDPTTEQVLAALPAASRVHLVTHGAHRSDNPLLSRLTTSDGVVFLADVLQHRLAAELVVLSACETGRVFSGAGEDLHGLALAFLAAGARHLVASQWRVEDRATLALMRAFYRELAASGSARDAAGALARAGRLVREEWDHPLFWGAFCAYGG